MLPYVSLHGMYDKEQPAHTLARRVKFLPFRYYKTSRNRPGKPTRCAASWSSFVMSGVSLLSGP
jgi:hypothetical protein